MSKPLPNLLAQAVTLLRIPPPQENEQDAQDCSEFLKQEIRKMSHLRQLILEEDSGTKRTFLSPSDIHDLVCQESLEELIVPEDFIFHQSPSGKSLLHLVVEKGNVPLVSSILSQMELCCLEQKEDRGRLSTGVNAEDTEGNTPLSYALQRGDEKLTTLLLRKEARGETYYLDEKSPEDSLEACDRICRGGHLKGCFLSEEAFSRFFQVLAESRTLLSLEFPNWGFIRSLKQKGPFFEGLAEALQQNFENHAKRNFSESIRILRLDLKSCKDATIQEVRPLLSCSGLHELWLSPSLIKSVDEEGRNLLHLFVSASGPSPNTHLAQSLISQGVCLGAQDHKGRTPFQLAQETCSRGGSFELVRFLEQALSSKLSKIAFGKKEWERYYGAVGKEPPLPSNMLEILESPCPIWPDKKVAETHLLTLIPKQVNGKLLTLGYLGELIQNPKRGGNPTKYRIYDEVVKFYNGEKTVDRSYWVLLTKDILPHTGKQTYGENCETIERWTKRSTSFKERGYRVPQAIETAASILMEYVRSGNRLYSSFPYYGTEKWTYTHCLEYGTAGLPVIIGGFGSSGLVIDDLLYGDGENDIGICVASEISGT